MANQCKEHNVEQYIQWVTTLILTIQVYLHSFSCCYLPDLWNSSKIQSYSSTRSSTLAPIESAYATSLIVTLDVCTIFDTLMHFAQK